MGRKLDVDEPIPESYTLEVSSPGVNRRIRKVKDFKEAVGKKVRVIGKESIGGRKKFTGTLAAVDDDGVTVAVEGVEFRVPHGLIERANLVHEFD